MVDGRLTEVMGEKPDVIACSDEVVFGKTVATHLRDHSGLRKKLKPPPRAIHRSTGGADVWKAVPATHCQFGDSLLISGS